MVTLVVLLVLGIASCTVVLLLVRCRRPAMASPVGMCTPQKASTGTSNNTCTRDEGGREWNTAATRRKEQQFTSSKPIHPLYSKLSASSGEVNAMTGGQVKQKLRELSMEYKGADCVLRKRLKNYLRREAIVQEPDPPWDLVNSVQTNPYGFDYLVVLDFEATCREINPPDFIHEIIEFPALLLNIKTLTVDAEFHTYCRPFLNPTLTDFCTKLTGIRQDQVDKAPYFTTVFEQFTEWLEERQLGTTSKFAIVTDCPWDIKECLFPQCVLSQVQFPWYATKWIDVRKLFSSFYRVESGNLVAMLEKLALQFEGRLHSGLHDSRNIVRIMTQLMKDGCVLKYNRFLPEDVVAAFSKKRRR